MPRLPQAKKTRARRRWLRRLGFFALGAGLGGSLVGCCVFSAPRYAGESPNFDGERFVNQLPIDHAGVGKFIRWQLTSDSGPFELVEDAAAGPPPPERIGGGAMRVTFVGHATLLVQTAALNILTDPIWSERSSPVGFVGPKRVRPPGVRFEELPPIDLVLISHNHYDHLDVPTLKRLYQRDRPRIVVGLGNALLLGGEGIDNVTELDWWQRAEITREVGVVSVPAQHFSGRGLCDRDGTLWTGYVVTTPRGSIYFAGDTGYGPHFRQIRERLGAPRLALLPIGAYLPRWFMQNIHISPDEAVQAHLELGAHHSVGMHFGTFPLADEGRDEAPERLAEALAAQGVERERFWVLGFGEGRDVPEAVER
jgi:L-ascorbate metabolism protein UlaG (beta-lactamase superfamily)